MGNENKTVVKRDKTFKFLKGMYNLSDNKIKQGIYILVNTQKIPRNLVLNGPGIHLNF